MQTQYQYPAHEHYCIMLREDISGRFAFCLHQMMHPILTIITVISNPTTFLSTQRDTSSSLISDCPPVSPRSTRALITKNSLRAFPPKRTIGTRFPWIRSTLLSVTVVKSMTGDSLVVVWHTLQSEHLITLLLKSLVAKVIRTVVTGGHWELSCLNV